MMVKTGGVVIRALKYRDNSLIADVFTEELGLRSYIVNGIYSKKGGSLNGYFQPLSLLDLVVYEREDQKLQRIKEIKLADTAPLHHFDFIRSGLILFAAEVFRMVLQERAPSPELYQKVRELVLNIYELKENSALFPQYFLLSLSKPLGIQPQGDFPLTGRFFDMREGLYVPARPSHPDFMQEEISRLTFELMQSGDVYTYFAVPKGLRQQWLENLLRYYEIHLSQFSSLKSLSVLSQILQQAP
jgi:DNA repair protein RecO (recombination protein O)